MKKLTLTIAVILGMSMTMFAQDFFNSNEEISEKGLFGRGTEFFEEEGGLRDGFTPGLPGEHGLTGNQNADAPLGSGIALLMGLGAAYAFAKKHEE